MRTVEGLLDAGVIVAPDTETLARRRRFLGADSSTDALVAFDAGAEERPRLRYRLVQANRRVIVN